MRSILTSWVALLAVPLVGLVSGLALPLQAQVGVHGGVAMDLWDRAAGYEEKGIGAAALLIAGADLTITRNLRLRLEYRGFYGIFPSAMVGLTFGSRSE